MKQSSIGVFDSGLGGFSVVKELKKLLPNESIEYFADHGRQPYGPKEQKEIEGYVIQIIHFLLEKGIKACIIACNTATAAGLKKAKELFDIPIIGVIEPGAEAAVSTTKNGKIGLIATTFTVNSHAYHMEIKKKNPKLEIISSPCPKFTPIVELGELETEETYQFAKKYLKPVKEAQVDTLILGCTHYPFLKKVISDIMGSEVKLVNPANNSILKLRKILEEKHLLNLNKNRKEHYYTSGNPDKMKKIAKILLGSFDYEVEKVEF